MLGRAYLWLIPIVCLALLAGCGTNALNGPGGLGHADGSNGNASESAELPSGGSAAFDGGAAAAGDADAAASDPASGPMQAGDPAADADAAGLTAETSAVSAAAAAADKAAGAADATAATGAAKSAPGPAESAVTETAAPAGTMKPGPSVKAGEADKSGEADKAADRPQVRISIEGDDQHGTIFAETAVDIKEGDTVLDVLKRVTRAGKIQMEFRGSGALAYVEGIDNLYEFDRGTESGWIFKVNGKFIDRGAGKFRLNEGDRIEWVFSLKKDEDSGKSGD